MSDAGPAPGPRALLIAVHSAAPGGAQAMALAEAERFSTRCRVIAAVPEGPMRERFAACAEVVAPAPSLPVWSRSPLRWALQLTRSCIAALRLARTIQRHDVDAVLTSSTVLLAPVLAARLAGVPAIAYAREWPISRAATLAFRLQRRSADAVVAISAGVAAKLAGAGRARILRIPDGIEVRAGGRRPARLEQPLRLCAIGSLTAGDGKGQHRAVEALARLGEQGIDATLSVVGPVLDEAYAERVRDVARRLGVAGRVRLTGAVDDVAGLLAAHDVLIFCSRQGADVTPLVLMEALAEERPVVAADVGSVAEILAGGDCGTLVPDEDPAAMAAAVARVALDPAAARAQAQRGASRIRAEYERSAGLDRLWEEIVALSRVRSRSQVPPRLIRFWNGRSRDAITELER
jgi:glycosyltransferase involved in cell wall biosynthesis